MSAAPSGQPICARSSLSVPSRRTSLTEQPERELDEMQERSDRLEREIADVREDWERKKGDSSVPGAPPDDVDGADDAPETDYPSKR
jgi:hypothetical protein